MVAGFNMLSFDLFGLGRRAIGSKNDTNENNDVVEKTQDDEDLNDKTDRQEQDIFFWSLYPVF